ncbi:Rne/Rng family ribonuclease [Clostridium botulinum C]|uniref:Ribonuclease G n=2 Tax=Clostridium botulinum TaxID=1491 RepID=A0A9P2G6H7_CLOBO|nr:MULTISPECIES: Rne/Rng family ribonuclease [Clostridium]EES90885.1 ribonuclease G [Clostridium botulinum D str. 1873]MCD3195370.1 Rne/Rng family ribonuclease [Clostridium botulinum C]MCD3200708.1 Rne/Rng family ribonuclease [Clostridium botulinum C]MCD3206116.1 Rne/Rng family ribonuclease [Clostridium botulinum C]MCD3208712.1 Rne/Rng family ribonuclease [Clostridium botulinum C]
METIYIEREEEILRIVLREDDILKECFIEEEKSEPSPGKIYKGVVKNIVPAIKCAFIDIGCNKNAYMYLHHKFKNDDLKNGDEVLVEIMKEAIGEKGPKVTSSISVPGRYVVIVTNNNKISFSKKIEDNDNFKCYIKDNVNKPEDIGIMIRTNALDATIEDINTEIEKLYETYKKIVQEGTYCLKPKLLYDGGGTLGRILNDILTFNTKKVVLNNEQDLKYIKKFIEDKSDLDLELQLYEGTQNLFSYYNIEREILSLRNNKVMLPSGGNIIIDKTEAMYVIDVNSGKNTKETSIDKTALVTNLEAAREIARQIMMRNLSGIIIIDFIDIHDYDYKKKILHILKDEFKEDKKKTVIYPFTQLNLVQIARKRRGKAISEYIEEECTMCNGKAKRIKLSYINKLIRNELKKIDNDYNISDIYIELDEKYKKDVLGDVIKFIKDIEGLRKKIYVNFISNLEYFKVEPLLFASQIKKLENIKIYG